MEKTVLGLQHFQGAKLESPIEIQGENFSIIANWQTGIGRNVQWNLKFPIPPEEKTLRVMLFADPEDDVSPTYCSGDVDPTEMTLDNCRVVGYSSVVKPELAGWIAAGWACAWADEKEVRRMISGMMGVKKSEQ